MVQKFAEPGSGERRTRKAAAVHSATPGPPPARRRRPNWLDPSPESGPSPRGRGRSRPAREPRPRAPGCDGDPFGGGQFHHRRDLRRRQGADYVVGHPPDLGGVGGVAEPLCGGGGGTIADDNA